MALRGLTLRACPPALCAQLMSSARAPDLGLSADTTRDDIEFVDIADCEDYTVGVFIVPKVLVHPFSLSLSLALSLSLFSRCWRVQGICCCNAGFDKPIDAECLFPPAMWCRADDSLYMTIRA